MATDLKFDIADEKPGQPPESTPTLTPTSAPRMPISEAEKQRLIALSEQNINASILKVVGPPGFHPYWANRVMDGQVGSVGYFEIKGFVVARDEPGKPESERFWNAKGFQPNGTYAIGDLILMFCPDEVWDRYEQQNLKSARRFAENVKNNFKDVARNLEGVSVYVPEK